MFHGMGALVASFRRTACLVMVVVVSTLVLPAPRVGAQTSDGKIVFSVESSDGVPLYTMNADGSGQRFLTKVSGGSGDGGQSIANPDWSPDGTKVAFAGLEDPFDSGDYLFDIYVIGHDGSGRRQLTNSSSHSDYPSWSPDGNSIVFSRISEIGQSDLYVIGDDGSNERLLTGPEFESEVNAAWSPDGTQIVFKGSQSLQSGLFVMDVDGGESRFLVSYGDWPSWSPDGRSIAFQDSDGDIAVIPAEGGQPTKIVTSTRGESVPSWSPSGTHIAFARYSDSWDVMTVPAGGGAVVNLTPKGGFDEREPDWQPCPNGTCPGGANAASYSFARSLTLRFTREGGRIFARGEATTEGDDGRCADGPYVNIKRRTPNGGWRTAGTGRIFDGELVQYMGRTLKAGRYRAFSAAYELTPTEKCAATRSPIVRYSG